MKERVEIIALSAEEPSVLGRLTDGVKGRPRRASSRTIRSNGKIRWSSVELKWLAEAFADATRTDVDIAAELGRSIAAVAQQRLRFGWLKYRAA